MAGDDAQNNERHPVTRGRALGVLAALALCAVVIAMFSEFQRRVIFPGPQGVTERLLHGFARDVGAHELEIETDDGETLYGWHRRAITPAGRAVLYFHGNASSVLGQLDLQEALNREGWDFVEIHYRGYPGSSGTPSETGVRQDARAAWGWVTSELGVEPSRVAIHGRSLGGAVAAQLASEVDAGALVLESTFTSVPDLAKEQFGWLPIGPLLEYRFDTNALASAIRSPVLVAHGDADSIIDVRHGQALAERFGASPYIEAHRVDHNDVLFEGERTAQYLGFLEDAIPRTDVPTAQP